ncbi:MAG TPA: YciI family protein [Anaeromyxobacteraceae bacterium]|nr:YciI family protein [Anaeromyxobacteraceae bacterium]
MKYLTFIRSSEKYRAAQPPPSLMEAMGKFIEKTSKEGALVATGGLAPSKDGFRMRLANRKLTITDGPFVESKEVIGGWAILEADSKPEIVRLTTEFMELHSKYWPEFEGECEVRPIEFDTGA